MQAPPNMQNVQEIHALRYPDNLGTYPELPPQRAAEMLMTGIRSSADRPYQWSWIDKPPEGAVYLLFLPPQKQAMPTDGMHFLQPNITSRIQLNPQAEIQIIEDRYGFTPGTGESMASRVRRRYSFPRGQHASFMLVHYTRGPATQIPPQLFAIPPRAPLPPLTQPAVYVTGPKAGTRAPPGQSGEGAGMGSGAGMGGSGNAGMMNGMGGGMGMGGPMGVGGMPLVPGQASSMMGMAPGQAGSMGGGMPPGIGVAGMGGVPGGIGGLPGMGMGSIQEAAARQRANFDALDAQARIRGVPMGGMPIGGPQSGIPAPGMAGLPNAPPGMGINVPRRDIEAVPATIGIMGPPDEAEVIEDEEVSTRSLAAARYRRNHEWMEGVFMYAAFGERTLPPSPKKLQDIFPREELDARVAALQAEVDALKSRKPTLPSEDREEEAGDTRMLSASVPDIVTS